MSLNISIASLRSLLALAEKREKLTGELSSIEAQIAATLGGNTPISKNRAVRKTRPPTKTPRKRGKRGAIKELILAGLKEAGEAGIAVRHLAAKLGLKPGSVHVWFGTTGKKSGLTEALGKGIYRLKQSVGAETPASLLKAPKQKVAKKLPKRSKTPDPTKRSK